MPIPTGYRNIDQDKVDKLKRIEEIVKCNNCSVESKYYQMQGVILSDSKELSKEVKNG